MTKEQRELLRHLKSEASSPKSDLMRIASRVEEISPSQARKLERAIALLERWQNT